MPRSYISGWLNSNTTALGVVMHTEKTSGAQDVSQILELEVNFLL